MFELALFGGTFDPIHIGHLRGLIEAKEALNIERVLVIPAGKPPHKLGETYSSPEARFEMAKIAVTGLEGVEVSDIELRKPGISYTIETIDEIQKELFIDNLALIIGSDSLLEFSTWHRFDEILKRTHLVVIPRPGFLESLDIHAVERAIHPVSIKNVTRDHPEPGTITLENSVGKKIILLSVRRINVSATEIREKVARGKSIKFLVPPDVERYIIEEKLYRR